MANIPKTLQASRPKYPSNGAFIKTSDANFGEQSSRALAACDGIFHRAEARTLHADYDTRTSIRREMTRKDYEFFRPGEAIPDSGIEIVLACRGAYRRVGIIRNVMDLMADFGAQGARLVHPNPKIQEFYRGWWQKVGAAHVCERFLNLLYREGVTIVKRTMGKVGKKQRQYIQAIGDKLQPDIKPEENLSTAKHNIPLRYNFLNPASLKPLSPELSQFVGKQLYAIKISYGLRQAVNHPKTSYEKELVAQLPTDIREAISKGDQEIPLDPKKVKAYFYKKDDWQTWADPMTYAIMDDIILLEKMKLADLAALDGAISQIRLWKLGSLDKEIFPTENAFAKLNEILLSNPGGGAFDIMWGPELEVQDYNTNVHQFLGKAKYEPVWSSIYEGLGVPPSLTGASGGTGMTNNYISLKTLVQRLEYGRGILRDFWIQEIELVRQAMGFKESAKLVFDNMVLADEAAEKALIIQLIDRDVISLETAIERFGALPEFEWLKLKKEEKERKKGNMKAKASPWHTPEKIYEFMKLALQRGFIAPEQTGMRDEIPEEFLDVETPFDQQMNQAKEAAQQKNTAKIKQEEKGGIPSPGRPKNAKDKTDRKSRTPKPLTGNATAAYLTTMMWAKDAQQSIADIINPIFLLKTNKKNLRALSNIEAKHLEDVKFSVLCNLNPYTEVNANNVASVLKLGKPLSQQYAKAYSTMYNKALMTKKELTLDDIRLLQASTYAALNFETLFEKEEENG